MITYRTCAPALILAAVSALACTQPEPTQPATPAGTTGAAAAPAEGTPGAATPAKLGSPAPDFTLPDLEGKQVKLADFKGKTVVLEWFNSECPFVKRAHSEGSLKGMAATYTAKGIVWLAINTGTGGKQGTGVEKNVKGKAGFGMTYPILLDESGAVGRLYGAKKTPHMYIIDPQGKLVYEGAIDNTKGGEPDEGDKVINYVAVALGELEAGKPVSTPQTEAFGCSVKY